MTATTWRNFEFTEKYIADLRRGVPEIADHFANYFGDLLNLKLRSRLRCPFLVEDTRQETLVRVLEALQVGGSLRNPERLGAFVNAVCNNVLLELWRKQSRYISQESFADVPDSRVDVEKRISAQERRQQVQKSVTQLPKRDRELIQMVFYDEQERPEACRRLGLDEEYARVVIHRAIGRLRGELLEPRAA